MQNFKFRILQPHEKANIKRARELLSLDKLGFIFSIIIGTLGLGSAVGLAATAAWIIARASQMPDVMTIAVAATSVRAFGIGKAVFRYIERLSSHSVAIRGMSALRTQLYTSIANGRTDAISSLRRGDLLARTGQDVDAIGDFVIKSVLPTWVTFFVGVVTVTVVACLHPLVGIILCICILIAGLVNPWLSARAARKSEIALDKARTELSALSLTMLEHNAELQVSSTLPYLEQALANTEITLQKAKDKAALPLALAIGIDTLCMGASVFFALLFGIPAVNHGALAPIDLAVIVLTPLAAFEGTAMLGTAAVQKVRSANAAARILHLLDQSGAPIQPDAQAEALIAYAASKATTKGQDIFRPEKAKITYTPDVNVHAQLDQVTPNSNLDIPDSALHLTATDLKIGWPGHPVVAENINLSIKPGESLAIIGPSGVGKSTLLYTLAGIITPQGGKLQLGDVSPAQVSRTQISPYLTYTAEDAHIFGTSIIENIRVARPNLTESEALQLLAQAGLSTWLAQLPAGIQTELGENGASVSGGERRRLLLARALASKSKFLILDEPAEHIDLTIADKLITDLINLTKQNKAVVMITHRLSPLAHADKIIILDHPDEKRTQPATIVAYGNHNELQKSYPQYAWAIAQEDE